MAIPNHALKTAFHRRPIRLYYKRETISTNSKARLQKRAILNISESAMHRRLTKKLTFTLKRTRLQTADRDSEPSMKAVSTNKRFVLLPSPKRVAFVAKDLLHSQQQVPMPSKKRKASGKILGRSYGTTKDYFALLPEYMLKVLNDCG
ncbi:hypothetical protein VTP01DRAFT_2764 [Rhizomucor pusillus]|uniref:uncharacterized protein n=1 Tax=Rhizomucor pusillus TaxID=4840 RepID=UPI00374320C2